jgi:SnoaL-like domain
MWTEALELYGPEAGKGGHRMSSVIERLHEAWNRHDLEALLGCFEQGYRSEQPAHPNRGFGGKEQVQKNWSSIFESFPDFKAELLRHTTDGNTAWMEVRFSGTGLNMVGVILVGVESDRIVWGRLYMEPVEEDGADIDEAVKRMTEGTLRQEN